MRTIFAGDFIDLPKITNAGQQNSVSLSSLTAHPTKWSALMCEIQSRLQVVKCLCIKPLGQSASPDVILMKRIERFTPDGKRLRMATLTVALAMKKYNSTCFSETQLKHECKIFDQMFKILGATVANPTELAKSAVKPIERAKPAAKAKSEAKTTKQAKPAGASNAKRTKEKLHQDEGMRFDEETKEACIGEQRVEWQESDERINVLIVCATNYCAGYAEKFGGKLYSVMKPTFVQVNNNVASSITYSNITEIILLDLTTRESRAEFFGLKDDEVLGEALDRLIKKVVPEKLSNNISAS